MTTDFWPETATIDSQPEIAKAVTTVKPLVRYRVRPLGDFVNTKGRTIALYGCSFADADEFVERVDYIRMRVQSSQAESFDELLGCPLFKHSVERCLDMHGISLSDISLRQLQDMLLYEVVDGELKPGLLLRLNSPRGCEESDLETMTELGLDTKSASYERALAILATHTSSVEEAIRLTHAMTMSQVTDLLKEASDLADPKAKQVLDKDMLKYMDMPTDGLVSVSL